MYSIYRSNFFHKTKWPYLPNQSQIKTKFQTSSFYSFSKSRKTFPFLKYGDSNIFSKRSMISGTFHSQTTKRLTGFFKFLFGSIFVSFALLTRRNTSLAFEENYVDLEENEETPESVKEVKKEVTITFNEPTQENSAVTQKYMLLKSLLFFASTKSVVLQRTAAQGFAYLAARDEATADKVVKQGGLEALEKLTNGSDIRVARDAFEAILELSNKDTTKLELLKANWLEKFQKKLNATQDVIIFQTISQSLNNLTGNDASCRLFLEKGGFELAKNLAEIDDIKVKSWSAKTFSNLCNYVEVDLVLPKGILDILYVLGKESTLAKYVAPALIPITKDDRIRYHIVDEKSSQDWLNLFQEWVKSGDAELRISAATILSHLAENDEIAIRMFRKMGLPLFVSIADSMDIDSQYIVERIFNNLKTRSQIEHGKMPGIQLISDDWKILETA